MKYTYFGFSQKVAVDIGLDLIDLAILRYFIDFKESGSMKKEYIGGEEYYWLRYENIITNNPIFSIKSKQVIARRLKNMVDKDILKRYIKKEKGTYTFYTIGVKYTSLLKYESNKKLKEDNLKFKPYITNKSIAPDYLVHTNNSSIKDSKVIYIDDQYEKAIIVNWNQVLETNIINIRKKELQLINMIIKEYGMDRVINNIKRISKSKYLLGKINGKKVDMEWFFIADNFIKVENGFYNDEIKVVKENIHKTKFHNFQQRSDNYSKEELDNVAERKREEIMENRRKGLDNSLKKPDKHIFEILEEKRINKL